MTTSRFSAVSRRAVLQGLSATAVLGLVGCSNSDADAGAIASGGAAGSSSPVAAPTASAAPGQFAIAFTFTVDTSATGNPGGEGRPNKGGGGPGGMTRNPYIAVWVEDASGALVRTISLWHLQAGQDRWLSELHRWYAASNGVDTTSGATRAPGTYDLTWDLSGSDGTAVPDGTYTLCVEASREHGPYSLVTGAVKIDGKALTQKLDGNGELSAVAISFQPA
ncbi:MAG: DUF2271 domain-containing protein [Actinobacteria bacterium]|nr:DUF2271 domain-containing protein [Actinomycetota bacterium]